MKIHSNTITALDLRAAVPMGCYLAGHYVPGSEEWASVHELGSRSRSRAFSVRLSGNSRYTMAKLPDKSATWDEWGIFIAEIFKLDPNAIVGTYKSYDDFISQTTDTFNRVQQYRPDMAPTHTAPWLVKN